MLTRRLLKPIRDERGASLAVAAVMLAGVMSVLALAIDLGMLYTARGEAQRTADSAALAGASVFLERQDAAAVPMAEARAMNLATSNVVRNEPVQEENVTVQVLPDQYRVRVWVRRPDMPTWFARLFGIGSANVVGYAAAAAVQSGTAKCLAPLAVPDMWHDPVQDENENRIWDEGEDWTWKDDSSEYGRYQDPDGAPVETGYGSDFRNGYVDASGQTYENDVGRPMVLKPQRPGDEWTPGPGFFFPWQIGDSKGGNDYRQNFSNCNETEIALGEPQPVETGNMVGPTRQGVDDVIALDPSAFWDPDHPNGPRVVSSNSAYSGDNWKNNPRILKFGMFNPEQLAQFPPGKAGSCSGANCEIEFNNFALIFVEEMNNQPGSPLVGRFIAPAPGSGGGSLEGSTVLHLRLVE